MDIQTGKFSSEGYTQFITTHNFWHPFKRWKEYLITSGIFSKGNEHAHMVFSNVAYLTVFTEGYYFSKMTISCLIARSTIKGGRKWEMGVSILMCRLMPAGVSVEHQNVTTLASG